MVTKPVFGEGTLHWPKPFHPHATIEPAKAEGVDRNITVNNVRADFFISLPPQRIVIICSAPAIQRCLCKICGKIKELNTLDSHLLLLSFVTKATKSDIIIQYSGRQSRKNGAK